MSTYSLLIFFIVLISSYCELNLAQDDISTLSSTLKVNSPVTEQIRDPVTSNITSISRAKRNEAQLKVRKKKKGVIPRIIRGFHCSTKEHGFMALLLVKTDNGKWMRICGSSLIKPKWVLTAAHCINPRKTYGVVVSMNTKAITIEITRIIVHPQYDAETFLNDIALLELKKPVSEKYDIKFVKLPNAQSSIERRTICNRALVMGWGDIEPGKAAELNDLQCAKIPMISVRKCAKMYMKYHDIHLPRDQICTLSTEGVDACQGDSGGPLLCESTQVGIVSWGISCAEPTNPGVYTDVSRYMDFIASKTRANVEARHGDGPLDSDGSITSNSSTGSTCPVNNYICEFLLTILVMLF